MKERNVPRTGQLVRCFTTLLNAQCSMLKPEDSFEHSTLDIEAFARALDRDLGAGLALRGFATYTRRRPSKAGPVRSRTACAIPLSLLWLVTPASADPAGVAASLIGRPYVWGAEGPNSFDCSGLTQYVYGEYGIDLPRRAVNQSQIGDRVGRRLQRGDLVFFSTDPGGSLVTHVGIYEGDGVMIDASKRHGRVRRDSLDEDYWVERFMFARRIGTVDDGIVIAGRRPQAPSPRSDRGKGTARVLEQIADVLLRRPRR